MNFSANAVHLAWHQVGAARPVAADVRLGWGSADRGESGHGALPQDQYFQAPHLLPLPPGGFYHQALPNMREAELRPLIERFAQLVI